MPFMSSSSRAWLALSFSCVLVVVGCSGERVGPGDDAGGAKNPVSDPDGGPSEVGAIEAAVAAIEDGSLDDEYVLDASASVNPGGRVLVHAWEVQAPAGDGCEGTIDDPVAAVATFRPSCRGTHRAQLTVSLVDESETSTAEVTFEVNNRAPVLSGLAQESAFLPGVDVVISGEVTDDDGDDTTCTARLAADNVGSPEGLVIPSEPAADCRFVISTPDRVETWKIEVIADDGFVGSAPATIEIKPGNDPPVIDEVALSADEVGYACVDGSCEAAVVQVTIDATDDTDAFEELVIVLEDVSVDSPADVEVEIVAVEGERGSYDVRVHRADLGPLAGTYTLEASVTEVTSEGEPATVTQQVTIDVAGEAPVIASVSADDVSHIYDLETGDPAFYVATLTVQVEASDPEDNALTRVVELLSCPTAVAGEAACGGQTLLLTETAADGELVVAVKTRSLLTMIGEYTFRVLATDADGDSTVEEVVASVLNSAPVLAPEFVSNVQQEYRVTNHNAAVSLVIDPDGDPLSLSLAVTCPDGSTVSSLPGNCGTGQRVDVPATGQFTVSGDATGLLGAYRIHGTASDRVADLDVDSTVTVSNTAPTLPAPASLSPTCHHRTAGTTVSSEGGACFSFDRTSDDLNGDPLTVDVLLSGSGFSLVGTMPNAPAADGSVSFTYGLQTTYDNFIATFSNQPQSVVVRVKDPFGAASPDVVLQPKLLNRAPVVSSKTFRNAAGTGDPSTLQNHEFDDTLGEWSVRHVDECHDGCGYGFPYAFSLELDVTDPDGDPLEAGVAVTCSDTVVDSDDGSPTTLRPLPASGLFGLQLPGRTSRCLGVLGARLREWTLSARLSCIGLNDCVFVPYLGCTLNGANSRLTDGLTTVNLGDNVSRNIPLANTTTPYSCSE